MIEINPFYTKPFFDLAEFYQKKGKDFKGLSEQLMVYANALKNHKSCIEFLKPVDLIDAH